MAARRHPHYDARVASRWYQPQDELPGRAPLPEPTLIARRERVFALLAALVVAAALVLPLLHTQRLFGASFVVRTLARTEPPVPLLVPLGALALPLALLALHLATALYGAVRACWLLLATAVTCAGALGLVWATDHVAAYDATTTTAFGSAAALAACGVITLALDALAFALLRRGWARHVVAPLVGLAGGWATYLALARSIPAAAPAEDPLGIALGAAGTAWLAVVAGSLLVAPVARALAGYLRIAPRAGETDPAASDPAFTVRKPRALIVETPVPGALRKRPFTTEEIAFFDAGDELASKR